MINDPSPLFDAREISAGYPGAERVVESVSLTLFPGRLFCLVGPNGAGKSTLLSALAGIVSPAEGTLLFNGVPLSTLCRMERARRIGYLPQIVRPSTSYTVYELVALGRYPHGTGWTFETEEDRHRIRVALEQTRTAHLGDRRFNALSGGERQRVLIASVLAGDPEAILLDEPTAALDISRGGAIFETLKRLAESGRTVGVVTHDLNLAGLFADDIGLMKDGHLVAVGPPISVLSDTPLQTAYGDGFQLVKRPDSNIPAVLPARRPR